MKLISKIPGIISRGLVVIMMALLTTQFLTAQDWYNSEWLYRSPVTISNPGTTLLTELQVKITLNSSFDFTKAKSDGSDIRVTSDNGMTLIPFWIEEWNMVGTTATLWVKVPNIPVAGTLLFLYYGNTAAASEANGYGTFEFFDDFEAWVQIPLPTPKADLTCAVYNGKIYAIGGYNNTPTDPRGETYEYDPVLSTWQTKAPIPTPRWGSVSVEYGGEIYVFGGQLASGEGSNSNEKYNPTNDTWTSGEGDNPLTIPHYDASGAVHPDVLYFPNGRDGYEYWMSYTPEPPNSEENPCILRSHDGVTWSDDGISNPVIPTGAPGTWNDMLNPDPDIVYIEGIDKWFMAWVGVNGTHYSSKIALAYSSDGKSWTQYNGTPVNGNTNPVILSGTDDYGEDWEIAYNESKVTQPTLFYDGAIFYLFYAEEGTGNNRGKVGLATFNWNNATNSIENLERNAGNPIIDLQANAIFKSGGGHIDISKNTQSGLYHMYIVRERLASLTYELGLLTSTNLTNWNYQGRVIEIGLAGEWDQTHIYRSCPVTNSAGEIVFFGDNIRIYYSAYNGGNPEIGIADILPEGFVQKFQGAPWPIPPAIAGQGIMGVRLGDTIHLFYKNFHYGYAPLTDTYARKPDVPRQLKWSTGAVVGSKIYLIGGFSDDPPIGATNVNYEWDPSNGSWAAKAPMPVSRYGATRENPVIDGKIYVTHGQAGDQFFTTNYNYDPATDNWLQQQSALHDRDGVGCGVINNKLYVVGGKSDLVGPFGTSYNEMYDPAIDTWVPNPTEGKWSFSGTEFVFTNNAAAYRGNYGLVVRQTDQEEILRWAESVEGFGSVYALDFNWNVTNIGGVVGSRPETMIRLTELPEETFGNLFFYNENDIQVLGWYNGFSFNYLQNGARNSWHKVTIVRNDADSRLFFDENHYQFPQITSPGTEGTGKFRFGLFNATTQYFDNVRVRKWAGLDLVAVTGSEEAGNFRQWTGSIDSDWTNTGNWESGVPESTTNAVIRNVPNTPHVNITGAVCNNLTIDPSASLTIDAGQALTINSGFANNGSLTIQSSGLTLSGSLIVNGTSTGDVTYNRQMRTEADDGDYHYFSSPVALNSATNSGKVTTVYQYNEVTNHWSTLPITSLQSGIGYNLDQTTASDGLISFTGPVATTDPISINATSPYRDVIDGTLADYSGRVYADGTGHSGITRDYSDLLYGGGGWNMLGNPYTSAILVSDFITANLTQFDPNYVAVYLYDGTSTGHTRYYYIGGPTGWGDPISQTHVQVGQGFFVLAMNDYSTFIFNKDMQDHSTGAVMLKSAGGAKDRWPGLQLKVKAGENENMTTIIFNEDMTVGLDPGYDVGLMSYNPGAGIYTALVEDNGINFARQALPVNGSVKNIIPVGIDFENGGKVTFSADVEPLRNYKFWLEDRTTGIFTELGTNAYSVTLPAKTYGTGRFYVHVATGRSIRPRSTQEQLHGIRVWASQNRQVNIQGVVSDRATCEVYDTFGHKIFETHLTDGDYNSFIMPSIVKGVYLVKITDGYKVITRKVVFL